MSKPVFHLIPIFTIIVIRVKTEKLGKKGCGGRRKLCRPHPQTCFESTSKWGWKMKRKVFAEDAVTCFFISQSDVGCCCQLFLTRKSKGIVRHANVYRWLVFSFFYFHRLNHHFPPFQLYSTIREIIWSDFCRRRKCSSSTQIRSAGLFFTHRVVLFSPSVCSRVEFSLRFLVCREPVKRLLLDEEPFSITWVFSTAVGRKMGICVHVDVGKIYSSACVLFEFIPQTQRKCHYWEKKRFWFFLCCFWASCV